jgi:hypothetical protein
MISTFFGLGRLSLAKVSLNYKFELSFLVGFTIFILATSFGYQFGWSLRWVAGILEFVGLFSASWIVYRKIMLASASGFSDVRFKSSSVILSIASVFLFIPSLVGGLALRVFQGNHWDYLSYQGIAQSISRYSFKTLLTGPSTGLALKDPITILATSSLHARPNVEIVLAALAAPFHLSILDNTYVFSIGLVIVLAFTMSFFAQNFLEVKVKYGLIVQTAFIALFVTGFWGQYLLDINALSALAVIPIYVGIFATISIYFKFFRFELAIILGLFEVTAALIYPEASAFLVPFFGLQIAVLVWFKRKKLNWKISRDFTAYQVITISLLFLSAYKPIQFAISQIHFASSKASAPWGNYFQAYLGGNDGLVGIHLGDLLRTFPLGVLGEYFLTPNHAHWNKLIYVISIVLTILTYISITLIIYRSRREYIKNVEFLFPLTLFLISLPLLYFKSTLWVAGKSFSFLVPILFLFIFYLTLTGLLNSHHKQKILITLVSLIWAVSQLGFGISRISNSSSGIVHNFPAYPAAQVSTMKSNQDWFLNTDFIKKSCSVVRIDMVDPFQNYYVEMKLNEKNVLWWDANPINTYFGNGSNVGTMKAKSGNNSCTLRNVENHAKYRFEFIKLRRKVISN